MKKYFYDYLGIAGSGLCLIHCLAIPFLFYVQNAFAQKLLESLNLENIYFEYSFVLLCFIAVFSTTKHNDSWKINTSFWLFFTLFAISVLFEDDFKYLDLLGYGASIGLIITHIININYCKKCQIENSPLPS
jgi:hypothetical protein